MVRQITNATSAIFLIAIFNIFKNIFILKIKI